MVTDQFRKELAEIKSKNLYRKLKVVDIIRKNKILVTNKWLFNLNL